MANIITESFGTVAAFTTTNISGLTASATAGWQSNAIDNTTTVADDALVTLELASAAYGTTAGNTVYVFGYGLITGTAYTTQGAGATGPSGSEGTITLPNVTSAPVNLPLLGSATQLGTAARDGGSIAGDPYLLHVRNGTRA